MIVSSHEGVDNSDARNESTDVEDDAPIDPVKRISRLEVSISSSLPLIPE
jgi:hypothetical protein